MIIREILTLTGFHSFLPFKQKLFKMLEMILFQVKLMPTLQYLLAIVHVVQEVVPIQEQKNESQQKMPKRKIVEVSLNSYLVSYLISLINDKDYLLLQKVSYLRLKIFNAAWRF